ncbi:MAG: DNA gyrase subunit A [Alphaproteobacteria bacterium]|nr:DNA gyrase subunit A [Alphaproteobacteria bacterium]
MKRSYLDYAMSVIVARALPDVRDGLKPVHRRILYAMKEAGYDYNKPFRKSARVVGDVMGKYHPHGDSAIYESMVRLTQDFSMRLPLIEGQGNFGSMDGDPAAAMRYTEARLALSADLLLKDIDKNTVDFQANYDGSVEEPTVLPASFPNILVNGGGGIAVGMATNIPPHNLGEVMDACCSYIDNPNISIEGLMHHIKGPDFPTGGEIIGRLGIQEACHTGRGSIIMRGKTDIEPLKDREAIIITEVPYQVNKAKMIEKIAELVRDKTIEGISDLRDESDRDGVRVVIELKRDATPEVILNQLYRFTPLQTSFGVNILALNNGRPELLNIKNIIEAFVNFREEVIIKRTRFDLSKAQERAHILLGLMIAVANLDPIIKLIRQSPDPASAKQALMAQKWPSEAIVPYIQLIENNSSISSADYTLSEIQAKAILDLRLHRLTALERDKLIKETEELAKQIADFIEILDQKERRLNILKTDFIDIKTKFSTPRRTIILDSEAEQDIEDLIEREDMVVTVTLGGYIKRVPLSAYRAQRRGGKGRSGMNVRDEDVVHQLFIANTHDSVLFFSFKGMVYKLKVYRLPLGTPQSRGKPLVQLLPLENSETISTLMPLPDSNNLENSFIIFSTATGYIRRNRLDDFVNVKANGKIAMKLDEGDQLISVQVAKENDDIFIATAQGKCIRFPVSKIRIFSGRDSMGVRGIKLESSDKVIAMTILNHVDASTEEREAFIKFINAKRRADETSDTENSIENISADKIKLFEAQEQIILTITENGYGKRTTAYEYRITGRGGSGITNIETSPRNGKVISSFSVNDQDHIMLVTSSGQTIRCPVHDIRIAGRRTQGVVIFKVDTNDKVVSVSKLDNDDDEDDANESNP